MSSVTTKTADLAREDFKREIERICRQFGFSISHEDTHGEFLIVPFDETLMRWFCDAEQEGA